MGEAFEDAFALLKIREAMDPRAFMEENDAPGLDRLGEILNNGPEDYSANVFQDAILEQMLDPSNQYGLTDAKTPTLWRIMESLTSLINLDVGGFSARRN